MAKTSFEAHESDEDREEFRHKPEREKRAGWTNCPDCGMWHDPALKAEHETLPVHRMRTGW